MLVVAALLFAALPAVSAEQLVFQESFDSDASIAGNGGQFYRSYSYFEDGLIGKAVHLKNGETVRYELEGIDELNEGTIEFFFKAFEDEHGLVNLGNNEDNLMAFLNYNRLWMEIGIGGFRQQLSKGDVSKEKWHHAALVWKCGNKKKSYFWFYLDGAKSKSKDWTGNDCGSEKVAGNFLLDVGTSFYYGAGEAVFDDLRIYDYILPRTEVKKRIALLENDPEKDVFKALYPVDNASVVASEGQFVDLEWTGPAATYVVEFSTQPDFPKKSTVSIKVSKGFFTGGIYLDDLVKLLKKTKYEGTDYYWRVLKKKGEKVYSEIRKMEVVYSPEKPTFWHTLSGEKISKGSYIHWFTGAATKTRLEASSDSDFSGRPINLGNQSKVNRVKLNAAKLRRLQKLAESSSDGKVYLRVKGKGPMKETLVSETVGVIVEENAVVFP